MFDRGEVGHPCALTTEVMMSTFDFGNLIAFSTVSKPVSMTVYECRKVCAHVCLFDSAGRLVRLSRGAKVT